MIRLQRARGGEEDRDIQFGRGAFFAMATLAVALTGSMLMDAAAQTSGDPRSGELLQMPMEALMDLEVTSVSKRPQRVADSAAAIFVLTQDDIRRSGALSLPETLRLVPGLHVARVDSNIWVVNARGFSSRFSTKFLVLIDGRPAYSPEFSGVFWDVQDTVLEDIERIEVIRGPGAALWGANAVNGVINVVTKRAQDTQGWLVSAGGGSEEKGFGTIRYGAKVGDVAARTYFKYFNRDNEVLAGPGWRNAGDGWHIAQGGFRLDADLNERDVLTVQSDFYLGSVGETFDTPLLVSPFVRREQIDQAVNGFNILGRWQRTFSEVSSLQIQTLYQHSYRDDLRAAHLRLDTFDGDFQHRFAWLERNDLVWGFGYRYDHFSGDQGLTSFLSPSSSERHLFSAFVNNDTSLVAKLLHLILGSKFEYNTFTHWEWEPNARILWTPHPDHSVWAAVSRAVRIPSFGERFGNTTFQVVPPTSLFVPPTAIQGVGSKSFGSEKLLAYEIGYRARFGSRLSFDIAAFYNVYDGIQFFAPGVPSLVQSPVPHAVFPVNFNNGLQGHTYGVETVSDIEVAKWWRLRLSYTYLEIETKRLGTGIVVGDPHQPEGVSPQHQAFARSSIDVSSNVSLDIDGRYVGSLSTLNVSSYVEANARLAWRPVKGVEVALVGRNLVHARHLEFVSPLAGPVATEIQREVYAKVTVKY